MSASNGQIVVYQHRGHKLFVMTHTGSVLAYRDGKLPLTRVLQTNTIFTNITRGDVAPDSILHDVFESENLDECCKIIIERGELQLTTAERRQMVEAKRREIIAFINKNYVDPQTQFPHPPARIEGVLSKVRFVPNAQQDARPQAEELLKKLRGKLAFAKAIALRAQLTLKHEYVGQLDNAVRQIATVTNSDWTGVGCTYTLELSRADMDRLIEALNKASHGDYDFRVLDEGERAQPPEETGRKGKQKKKKKNRNRDASAPSSEEVAPATAPPQPPAEAQPESSGRKKKKKKKHRDEAPPVDAGPPPPTQEEAEVPSRKRKRKKKNRRSNQEE